MCSHDLMLIERAKPVKPYAPGATTTCRAAPAAPAARPVRDGEGRGRNGKPRTGDMRCSCSCRYVRAETGCAENIVLLTDKDIGILKPYD